MRFEDLTEGERRYLGMHATYEAKRQDDFRYFDPDPVVRARLRARWMEIADALHPAPWDADVHPPTVEPITDYQQLHDLPEGRLVRDASGEVWRIYYYRPSRTTDDALRETWLQHFSDEYAFWVRRTPDPTVIKGGGLTAAIGSTPPLPITDLGIDSAVN